MEVKDERQKAKNKQKTKQYRKISCNIIHKKKKNQYKHRGIFPSKQKSLQENKKQWIS